MPINQKHLGLFKKALEYWNSEFLDHLNAMKKLDDQPIKGELDLYKYFEDNKKRIKKHEVNGTVIYQPQTIKFKFLHRRRSPIYYFTKP